MQNSRNRFEELNFSRRKVEFFAMYNVGFIRNSLLDLSQSSSFGEILSKEFFDTFISDITLINLGETSVSFFIVCLVYVFAIETM